MYSQDTVTSVLLSCFVTRVISNFYPKFLIKIFKLNDYLCPCVCVCVCVCARARERVHARARAREKE